jgi:predicted DNA-binding protein (UPF0251 family)
MGHDFLRYGTVLMKRDKRRLSTGNQENLAPPFQSGEDHRFSKLTWKDVEEIRKVYQEEEISIRKLADRYGVRRNAIWSIIKNKSWVR